MTTDLKNKVLSHMARLIDQRRVQLIASNIEDLAQADPADLAMYDRLKIDDKKVESMIRSLQDTIMQPDPIGRDRYEFHHPQGMRIVNRTAPFGTILIIYESRPDVTIEAAALAFKADNTILLKGGKEARSSNLYLVALWHESLSAYDINTDKIQYLDYTREQTSELLKTSGTRIDLVVPRGGDALIEMVRSLSTAPVLVSGRGNNFVYIHEDADIDMAIEIVINSKMHKISVCNATDKVLFDRNHPQHGIIITRLIDKLHAVECEVLVDKTLEDKALQSNLTIVQGENIWYEEFLAKKIMFSLVDGLEDAIAKINTYSGGHTAVIVSNDSEVATKFMESIDAASVIHNASSRYTDGGQFGLGAELAISTDKLHHRGPLGLDHLVTNKWYVYGQGQVRY
ncbi:MAG: glutamate-5-semialdehyde dehydrogenase [Saprospiraceae bacterium]|nr:glutamate-5-semialdehyde dehydrogenase [Saprospiraceae bacterium]